MTFILTELFSDSPQCRIIEIFVENPDDVLSLHEIKRMSSVESGWAVYNCINNLIDLDIVEFCGMDGNIKIYKLNTHNTIVKILITLERSMVAEAIKNIIIEEE